MAETHSGGEKCFEIALVMAGAISAGAYTAGVIDFLLQALDEWEKARKETPDQVPSHKVRIKVISGASAGGMTAALMASALCSNHKPATMLHDPAYTPTGNKLYQAWVKDVDAKRLLGAGDLQRKKAYISLLDSTVLDEIAQNAFTFEHCIKKSYVADPLRVYLTISNLEGIPFMLKFGNVAKYGYGMLDHGDHVIFDIGATPATKPDEPDEAYHIKPGCSSPRQSYALELFRSAALATGAHPLGFAPRLVQRRRDDYNHREQNIPLHCESFPASHNTPPCPARSQLLRVTYCTKKVPPDRSSAMGRSPNLKLLCVDGGMINNEPLELARRCLAHPKLFTPREPEHVTGATIMIDPFPTFTESEEKDVQEPEDICLPTVLQRMFSSLMEQARFKLDELLLAQSEDVYSRYLIVPSRPEARKTGKHIACGILGGFGGFMSEQFRRHDFQLGRRNCQNFLKSFFGLPPDKAEQNRLFQGTILQSCILTVPRKDDPQARIYPIIPLCGSAREEVLPICWERLRLRKKDVRRLTGRALCRLVRLIARTVKRLILGWKTIVAVLVLTAIALLWLIAWLYTKLIYNQPALAVIQNHVSFLILYVSAILILLAIAACMRIYFYIRGELLKALRSYDLLHSDHKKRPA
ncbi:patatin-like phospholipase family protein [Desulfocurvibacter africanus]|uniref:Patatin n=1 Tax=Desulfocurvibacter africanus subsp. africanus str. Walvis Bay TaxID=690850 RepID=F3YXG9_DESAF|nr:patatin-like phospholipase family protein [Desulfocurvibacter africanus]EGJ51746.1 Patatin [Desulfocurvibacter africanus subsp. africanus str. Walvis Bay]